jgi:hypothetical protein
MNEIVIQDFPGKQVRLERIAPEGMRSQVDLARLAADALFLFADGIYEPVSMDLQVACCDPETGYPEAASEPHRRFWLFRLRNLPAGVEIRPAWTSEELVTVDRLDTAAILDCLEAPLRQDCNAAGEEYVGWQEMLFRTARVRLPDPLRILGGNSLVVRYGRGSIEHPIERCGDARWVWGPLARKTLGAPIELKLGNEAGLLTFDIWLLWSLWSDEDGEGWKDVQRALGKLSNLGWTRCL